MTPLSPDLKELAKQAIDQGEIQAAKFLLGKIDPAQPGWAASPSYANAKAAHAKAEVDLAIAKQATVKPKVATVQPVLIAETALPGLGQSLFSNKDQIELAVVKYLRQLDQRHFRYIDVAEYFWYNYSCGLDQSIGNPGDRRAKWRRQISKALARFKDKGWIVQGEKNTHYIITASFPKGMGERYE